MAKLNPYLNFNSNCREAMTFYQSCLGGELYLQTVKELPEMAAMMPPHLGDHILHSVLTSGDIVIMASDLNKETPVNGNTYQLCIQCDTEEQLMRFFTGLSEGGTVNDPIADMPWGAKFGALTDSLGRAGSLIARKTDNDVGILLLKLHLKMFAEEREFRTWKRRQNSLILS